MTMMEYKPDFVSRGYEGESKKSWVTKVEVLSRRQYKSIDGWLRVTIGLKSESSLFEKGNQVSFVGLLLRTKNHPDPTSTLWKTRIPKKWTAKNSFIRPTKEETWRQQGQRWDCFYLRTTTSKGPVSNEVVLGRKSMEFQVLLYLGIMSLSTSREEDVRYQNQIKGVPLIGEGSYWLSPL